MKLDEESTEALATFLPSFLSFASRKCWPPVVANIFAGSWERPRTFRCRETHPRRLSRETLHSRWQSPRRGASYYISLFSSARPLLPSSFSRPAPPCLAPRESLRSRTHRSRVDSLRGGPTAARRRHGETRVYPRRRRNLATVLRLGIRPAARDVKD